MLDFIVEVLTEIFGETFGQGLKKINFTKLMGYFILILVVITIISWIIALALM